MAAQTAATDDYRASFDLTEFPSPEAFEAVLDECGLVIEDYPDEPFDDWDGWVWSRGGSSTVGRGEESTRREVSVDRRNAERNEYVAMHTYANPLTGEHASFPDREKEPGYASYIHIIGEKDAVRSLYESIVNHASYRKDGSLTDWIV